MDERCDCLLKDTLPLASGSEKSIYQHPDSPQHLIKVWHEEYFYKIRKENPIFTRLRRLPRYSAILKEFTEHLCVREWNDQHIFIQKIVGVVDTDLGVGLVVRKVARKNGDLARNLSDLLNSGEFSSDHRAALDEFLNWLKGSGVIVRDLGTKNLVWDEIEERFVVIDGIGGKARISLREYCKWYNRRSNNRRADKLLSRVEHILRGIDKSHSRR